MKTVTVYQGTIGLVFIFYMFHEHIISADDSCEPIGIFRKFENVKQLLSKRQKELKLSEEAEEAFYVKHIKTNYVLDERNKVIERDIFNTLKLEFDVASCIFRGVATVGGIENAVIYLHTTKYLFTPLRYTLDLFSDKVCFGKMETDLALFASVLNTVLLYGDKGEISDVTYSGETFMCEYLKDLSKKQNVVFHTFMPSSKNAKVAKEYVEKKGATSCIYIFKNTNHNSIYSPRSISALSYEPLDEEAVYPIGAAFQKIECEVNDKNIFLDMKTQNIICLDLLSVTERTDLEKKLKKEDVCT